MPICLYFPYYVAWNVRCSGGFSESRFYRVQGPDGALPMLMDPQMLHASPIVPSPRPLMKVLLLILFLSSLLPVHGELWMPAIFSDHMVLQREIRNPVWGEAEPGQKVSVTIGDQEHHVEADAQGAWRVQLTEMSAGGPYELVVQAGQEKRVVQDILVGEVWFCSGQSNMVWQIYRAKEGGLETVTAHYPEIRHLRVPSKASQESLKDFEGEWKVCTPENAKDFSAVGYLFGRRIHMATGVPVGLVTNAWGGSSAEAWVPREVLEADERYHAHLAEWDDVISNFTEEGFAKKMAVWAKKREAWVAQGRTGARPPRQPRRPHGNKRRPANIYHGVLAPTIGYGLREFIWYQGESNAAFPRAYHYRYLFPELITHFRKVWGQGDFPFYWVQLADFQEESETPEDPAWAWIRESQTLTLDAVSNAGQAVIIDAGEGRDIHPRDKHTVADRLARIALARDYGFDLTYQSPRYRSMDVRDGKALLTFDHVTDQGLWAFDVKTPLGFSIAGEDRNFVWAEAKLVGKDQVEVWSDRVPHPVAVRYAWGGNPVCNLYDRNGLPVTPFRTDSWPYADPSVE